MTALMSGTGAIESLKMQRVDTAVLLSVWSTVDWGTKNQSTAFALVNAGNKPQVGSCWLFPASVNKSLRCGEDQRGQIACHSNGETDHNKPKGPSGL
ncbi:hypothetical protein [uncultured Aliiroseovarius sp.]|uniref:hypothetical protein n=1 Tax=uncultured Aliiroseovarius sp. TaxID=1658783 RepID=UPI0025952C21|nr:hypothetical protein [uncultured Aliiroseovarius sp.]MCI2398178.1 hypothetical protein [Aliiroseovarius subalbicans]